MKNVRYYDISSGQVKTAQHVSFDEAMHDLNDKPPNVRLLASLKPETSASIDTSFSIPDLDISSSPFLQLHTITMPLDLSAEDPLSLSFRSCHRLKRAYLADIHCRPIGLTLQLARRTLLGSYVVSVNGTPVFAVTDISKLLSSLQDTTEPVPSTLEVVLAPARSSSFDDRTPLLHLRLHDLRHIHALQLVAGEDVPCNVTDAPFDETLACKVHTSVRSLEASLCDIDMACAVVHCLQTSGMTDEEQLLKCFTHCQLRRLKNWPDWDDAQLNAHRKAGCIGTPVLRPASIDGQPPNVLHIHWTNGVSQMVLEKHVLA